MVTQSTPEFSLWRRSGTPPMGARIRPEGADNYAKGRGTLHKVVFQQVNSSSPSSPETLTPRPSPRCPTPAAKVNYQLGVHGNVGDVLKGTSTTPRPTTAPPRVKTEAAEIASLSRGTRMRSVLHEHNSNVTDDPASARAPRVKPEGEPIASISKGKRMNMLIHEYGQHVPAPRQPRVRAPEAQENANTAKGGRMHSLMHKYGTLPVSSRATPRVRPEGMGNASLGKGARMDSIIHQNATDPPANSRQTSPRVRPEAEPNADLGKGKRMATLLHHPSALPAPARSTPRVKPEASRSADLDRGPRMAQLMHEGHSLPEAPRPASRAVGEQAKRNLWRGVFGTVGSCLKQSGRKTCLFLPVQKPARRLSRPCVV